MSTQGVQGLCTRTPNSTENEGTTTTPSLRISDDECVIDRKRLRCMKHDCAVKIVNVSAKKWQWIENKKQYGNVYRKTKKYICQAQSQKLVREPRTPEPGGEPIIFGNDDHRTPTTGNI